MRVVEDRKKENRSLHLPLPSLGHAEQVSFGTPAEVMPYKHTKNPPGRVRHGFPAVSNQLALKLTSIEISAQVGKILLGHAIV
jgi:hypothetical protein